MTLKEEHMEEGQPAAEAAATAAPAAGAAANQPPPPEYCEVAVAAAASTTTAAMAATTATTVEAALSPPHEPPPAYQVAAALPSYEEAERTKGKFVDLTLVSVPPSLLEDPQTIEAADNLLLGNDFVFFTAFITAFLFNWIGFLLLMCFCHTIAARYGALSGFGLSLTKWTLIMKHSTELTNGGDENPNNNWLWWLIMAFGLLICVRAIIQYLHIKRAWPTLTNAARERLFFFY